MFNDSQKLTWGWQVVQRVIEFSYAELNMLTAWLGTISLQPGTHLTNLKNVLISESCLRWKYAIVINYMRYLSCVFQFFWPKVTQQTLCRISTDRQTGTGRSRIRRKRTPNIQNFNMKKAPCLPPNERNSILASARVIKCRVWLPRCHFHRVWAIRTFFFKLLRGKRKAGYHFFSIEKSALFCTGICWLFWPGFAWAVLKNIVMMLSRRWIHFAETLYYVTSRDMEISRQRIRSQISGKRVGQTANRAKSNMGRQSKFRNTMESNTAWQWSNRWMCL